MDAESADRPNGSLRAAFVTSGNPHQVGLWSGIPYHMLRALEKHFDMALVIEAPWPDWFVPIGRALKLASGMLFQFTGSPRYTALAARKTLARIRAAKPDVVFAVSVSPMTHLLVKEFRVVHIADATVRAMDGYYDAFSKLSRPAFNSLDRMEATILKQSFLSIFPSRWACESALNDYDASPAQVREIAWGANIGDVCGQPRELPDGELRFLFVGVDFARKGGPIALDVIAELTRRGVACRLDVVGCTSEVIDTPLPPNVNFHGFVSKATAEGRTLLDRLYAEATFFFLPTQAECYGIVFAEAAHNGLPSLSFQTGGVPSVVRTGETGVLLPLGASASDFSDTVCALIATPERYRSMSLAALSDAKSRLNWQTWASDVEAAISDRLRQNIEIPRTG